MSKLKKAIEVAGGQSALANAINGTPQLVNNWVRRNSYVPAEYCPRVEKATGVNRRDLRPEDWWLIWPELVNEDHPIPASAPAKEAA